MRAHEYLFESDQRTTLEKLKAVIDHPNTEATIRAVAQRKYDLLVSQEPVVEYAPPAPRLTIASNISSEHLDVVYIADLTIGQIYDAICSLKPCPSYIQFTKMGMIYLTVPPPYHGLTKPQYIQHIMSTVPGLIRVSGGKADVDKMGEFKGYLFTLHYL